MNLTHLFLLLLEQHHPAPPADLGVPHRPDALNRALGRRAFFELLLAGLLLQDLKYFFRLPNFMGNVLLLPYQFRVQLDVLVLLQQLELELLAADVGDAGVGLEIIIYYFNFIFLRENLKKRAKLTFSSKRSFWTCSLRHPRTSAFVRGMLKKNDKFKFYQIDMFVKPTAACRAA